MLKKCNLFGFLIFIFFLASCKEDKSKETILKGNVTVVTDESILPIVEDELLIFQDRYKANVKIESNAEAEIVRDLTNGKYKIAFMSRSLNKEELDVFEQKKIIPRITPFATDAIVFIANKKTTDTVVDLESVISFLKGNADSKIKGLVFDNLNSSTARQIKELAKIEDFPSEGVYSFKSNEEVIKFITENEGMMGVVGYNWITQPTPEMETYSDKYVVLSIKGVGKTKSYSPSQFNLANNLYPLSRDLYIVNCQGTAGLGMGIASFFAGEVGQRIVLKSELLPYKTPSRKIIVREAIEKKEQNN
ncbi:PstS family phosphate ABC transporter substrate-binding protein [Flavobacterium agrisoli]|uniref:Substrate-binding domain-containing protein n=1 Tax=Flavobacterium agrisoli TaxID=2793066 RepID=A0A934UJ88_9FLAO|nr:substrate-binding domain-containing protein [Flavobacterium agrisoli]MBK0369228.1 substrate-binding domain-containing protein [Flavobacterium agrisoli]